MIEVWVVDLFSYSDCDGDDDDDNDGENSFVNKIKNVTFVSYMLMLNVAFLFFF